MIYTKYKCRICESINNYVYSDEKIDVEKSNDDSRRMARVKLFYFERLCNEYYCKHCKLDTMHDLCAVIGTKEKYV